MRIDFFEEFPDDENLKKAKLINFNSTIYIAAKSFRKFQLLRKRLNEVNPKLEAGYWPILEKSYWISPFSYTYELKNLFNDLEQNKLATKKLKVLVDLELPFLNKKLFFVNLFSFFRNKKLIKKIFKNSDRLKIDILTAEYAPFSGLHQKILQWLGVSYPVEKFPHKKIIMFYSSMIKNKDSQNSIKQIIIEKSKQYRQHFQVGLGTIATGILGDEPILSPKNLDKDLAFLKKHGIETAVIFRLGGLNKEYLKIIKKYL